VTSAEVELRLLDAATMLALAEGRHDDAERALGVRVPRDWPDEHDARFLRLRADQLRDGSSAPEWSVRAVVRGDELVGHAGFHGPPGVNGPALPNAVEIGYTIFPEHRGRGYAQQATRELIALARASGVAEVIASIAPDNEPSLAIVQKLGFVQTGEQWDDEDGLELVFELELS
jgi:RimJ/RimL family protein N-acetyltransferase